MKRLTQIMFLALYSLMAVHVTVDMHKCLGRIQSLSLVQSDTKCCCAKAGMERDCCSTETVVLAEDSEGKVITSFAFSFDHLVTATPVFPVAVVTTRNFSEPQVFPAADTSPPNPIPAYIAFCSLTYYG